MWDKKDVMKKILQNFKFLFMPDYWLMNHPYSEYWDNKLKKLMGANKFTNRERHTAKLGGFEIWISNHPYASFYDYGNYKQVRPSRQTIYEARKKLNKEAPEKDPYFN